VQTPSLSAKVWASRSLNLLDVRRDQAKDVTIYFRSHGSALLVHQWPTSMAYNVATAVYPMRPSLEPKATAWKRSKTSDKLLGAFRLARAVKIEDSDLLQTTRGFNCAVCYMFLVLTIEFTNNESWLLVHGVWSVKSPHVFRTEWPPEDSLFLHDRPDQPVALLSGYETEDDCSSSLLRERSR
jgi:hypothetical protein